MHEAMTAPLPPDPLANADDYLPRPTPGLNRLVVVLVGSVVLAAAIVALVVAAYWPSDAISATFRTVALGPLQLTVSEAQPERGLVMVAIGGIALVALVALLLEGTTALLSARPRRRVLSARRHGMRRLPPTGPVRSTVRDGDLVSRWHANGFLVMGFGMQPDPGMLARRVQDQVSATGVDLGKWPIEVTAGTAAGSPEEDGAMPLIAAAEHGASA
jgi:hypothetical protein